MLLFTPQARLSTTLIIIIYTFLTTFIILMLQFYTHFSSTIYLNFFYTGEYSYGIWRMATRIRSNQKFIIVSFNVIEFLCSFVICFIS